MSLVQFKSVTIFGRVNFLTGVNPFAGSNECDLERLDFSKGNILCDFDKSSATLKSINNIFKPQSWTA